MNSLTTSVARLARRSRRGLASVLTLIMMGSLSVPLMAAVDGAPGRTIEVWPDLEFVIFGGFPTANPLLMEVYRDGVKLGETIATPESDAKLGTIIEINHIGGGRMSTGEGDCWGTDAFPFTPDIQPGDEVRATVLDPNTLAPTADVDFTMVRGISVSMTDGPGTDEVTLSGSVVSTNDAPIEPVPPGTGVVYDGAGTDVLELRVEPAGVRDFLESGDFTGTSFTRTLSGVGANERDEFFLEWSGAGQGAGNELTVATAEEVIPCPDPKAEHAVTGSVSHPGGLINIANSQTALQLSGVSVGTSAVSVTLSDTNGDNVVQTATPANDTFEVTFPANDVAGLADGVLTVTDSHTTTGGGNVNGAPTFTLTKDTVAPATPSVPDLADASDLGSSNTDNLTSDSTPTFVGTVALANGEALPTVEIWVDGALKGSAASTVGSAPNTADYSVTTSALTEGDRSVRARAVDPALNASGTSAPLTVTIEAPPAPPAPAPPAAPPAGGGGGGGTPPTSPTSPTNTSASGDVAANGTIATNGTSASASNPIVTSVTSPNAGPVSIQEGTALGGDPAGYELFGQQVVITAPAATAANPLVFSFRLDGSVLDGTAVGDVVIFRNGVALADCTAADATPDPCVASRVADGDDAVITVRTSMASTWTFGREVDATAVACGESVPAASFVDVVRGSTHAAAIDCVAWYGITEGISAGYYAPSAQVSRGQMASFITRLLAAAGAPVETSRDFFTDDASNPHESAINAIASVGIVEGVGGGRYAPNAPVSRAQMATFLVRSYQHVTGSMLSAGADAFSDDNGNRHEDNINRAAAAGFASGVGNGNYDPTSSVRRDQMASFLTRVLDQLISEGHGTPKA